MCSTAHYRLVALALCLFVAAETHAQEATAPQLGAPQQYAQQPPLQQQPLQQQPIQQQPAQQPPVTPQAPPGFQLNVLEQQQLDAVLDAWQRESGTINTFRCTFQRLEYDVAFGDRDKDNKEIPLFQNSGELSYHRPDKGSFQITQIKRWTQQPAPAGQQPPAVRTGDWLEQPNAIGDHWVCDGQSVYQYRPDVKQLVEHPIPPQLQGQAIVDGPLPFLFGADAAKLKQRYWLKLDHESNRDPNTQIWLIASPRFQAQAADFSRVDVVLDRQLLMPMYMQVWMPNRSHHVYIFDIRNASKNTALNQFKSLFERPSTPFGWKRVVENVPLQQAAQPVPPPAIRK